VWTRGLPTVALTLSKGFGTNPQRVHRHADQNCDNLEHTKRTWTVACVGYHVASGEARRQQRFSCGRNPRLAQCQLGRSPDGLDAAGDNATGVPRKAETIPAVPKKKAMRRHARGGLMVGGSTATSVSPRCRRGRVIETRLWGYHQTKRGPPAGRPQPQASTSLKHAAPVPDYRGARTLGGTYHCVVGQLLWWALLKPRKVALTATAVYLFRAPSVLLFVDCCSARAAPHLLPASGLPYVRREKETSRMIINWLLMCKIVRPTLILEKRRYVLRSPQFPRAGMHVRSRIQPAASSSLTKPAASHHTSSSQLQLPEHT